MHTLCGCVFVRACVCVHWCMVQANSLLIVDCGLNLYSHNLFMTKIASLHLRISACSNCCPHINIQITRQIDSAIAHLGGKNGPCSQQAEIPVQRNLFWETIWCEITCLEILHFGIVLSIWQCLRYLSALKHHFLCRLGEVSWDGFYCRFSLGSKISVEYTDSSNLDKKSSFMQVSWFLCVFLMEIWWIYRRGSLFIYDKKDQKYVQYCHHSVYFRAFCQPNTLP